MKKTYAQVRRELAELVQERRKLLDGSLSKSSGPLGGGTLKRNSMMNAERRRRVRDLEKRIKGLKAKLT